MVLVMFSKYDYLVKVMERLWSGFGLWVTVAFPSWVGGKKNTILSVGT